MFPVQDFSTQSDFTHRNRNEFYESEACLQVKEIFAHILKNLTRSLNNSLREQRLIPCFASTTRLDLELMYRVYYKWAEVYQYPLPFELIRHCFKHGEQEQIRILTLPDYAVDIPWNDIDKIASEFPRLERLEFSARDVDRLDFLFVIEKATNSEREKSGSSPIVFRVSISLNEYDLPRFKSFLEDLKKNNVSPETFQIEVNLESFNFISNSPNYSDFFSSAEIYNSPYIYKIKGEESALKASYESLPNEQEIKAQIECEKILSAQHAPDLFLSQVKEFHNQNKSKSFDPGSRVSEHPNQRFLDFFCLSRFSKLEIDSVQNFSQKDLNTTLSLNIYELVLRNLDAIRTLDSDNINSITCIECKNLVHIETKNGTDNIRLENCPNLRGLTITSSVAIKIISCASLTEFTHSSTKFVSFIKCASLLRVIVPSAIVCEFVSCPKLGFISASSAYEFKAQALPSLEALSLEHTKKIELAACTSFKTLIAPSAKRLHFKECDALEHLNAPHFTGIIKKPNPSRPGEKTEEQQTLQLGPNIIKLNLPLFQGKLVKLGERPIVYFNAPQANIEASSLTALQSTVVYKRTHSKSIAVHIIAFAILATLGVFLSFLSTKEEEGDS